MSAFSRLARIDDRWLHDGVVVRRGGSAREVWERGEGQAKVSPWDPERPVWHHVNRFRRTIDADERDLERLWDVPVYARFYLPVGLTSDARMLVYDGDRFVCWFGLLRADPDRPFTTRELRRLGRAAPSFTAELVALDRRRRAEERGAPADLVFKPDGKLEAACDEAQAWVDRERASRGASFVREVDRRGGDSALVDGRVVHVTRMTGPEGVRYLLNLRAPSRPRVAPEGRLTERQREAAKLAARGATAEEIAAHMGVSRETVRQHLRRAYDRLEVANRLELARVLDAKR